MFGSEIVNFLDYLNEKMYVVQDTLLIDNETVQKIYLTQTTIGMKKIMIENMIDKNRKIVLKSPDVLYEIHEDINGRYIYVDKETLTLLNTQNDVTVIGDVIDRSIQVPNNGIYNKSKYNNVPINDVIRQNTINNTDFNKVSGFGSFGFSGLSSVNFESVEDNTNNSSDNGSSLDDFFKPII